MKAIHQILAIARTEFRFGLRRGAPVVVTAIIGIIVSAAILLNPFSNLGIVASDLKAMPVEVIAKWTAVGIDFHQLFRDEFADLIALGSIDGWIMMYLALVFLPVTAVTAVPADRKFGVSELLQSTPINAVKYLAGKILGFLGVVLLVGSVTLLIFFITIEIAQAEVLHLNLSITTILFYIKLSLVDGLPLLLWGSTIGILAGVLFKTRRGALLPGFLTGLLNMVFWGYAFKAPATNFQITDVASYYVFQNYESASNAIFQTIGGSKMPGLLGEKAPAMGIGPVLEMYSAIFLLLFIFTALACFWLQRKENF